MLFQSLALLLLLAFYGIYFGKMLLQRRRGIQTNQLVRGDKPARVRTAECLLSVVTVLVPLAQLISIAQNTHPAFIWVRVLGVVLGVAGVVAFALSVQTMRDSWRAGIPNAGETELVTSGIYRFSRNPAFLGFDLLYLGLLFLFFNWILLALTALAMLLLHVQILQEEQFLQSAFGDPYVQYHRLVRRYLGRRAL